MSKFKVGDRVRLVKYPEFDGTILSLETKVDNEIAVLLMDNGVKTSFYTFDIDLIGEDIQELKEYEHYKYSYKGIKLDPYRILDIYKITCPAQQHAIKKLLRAGNSVKELKQDITEVIDTLKRKLEMLEEDSDNP